MNLMLGSLDNVLYMMRFSSGYTLDALCLVSQQDLLHVLWMVLVHNTRTEYGELLVLDNMLLRRCASLSPMHRLHTPGR